MSVDPLWKCENPLLNLGSVTCDNKTMPNTPTTSIAHERSVIAIMIRCAVLCYDRLCYMAMFVVLLNDI